MATRPSTYEPAREPDLALEPDLGVSGDGGTPYGPASAADPAERVQERLWWAAAVVWRRKWWIVAGSLLVAGLAVWLTLQIPNRYRAETRVLLPDSGSSGLTAILGRSQSAAAALLGGGGGGYTRYLAILTSRSALEDVVERYDLVRLYDTGDQPSPVAAAVGRLAERTDFDVSLDYDYLAIQVLDEDPERAAQMANTFVEILNRENIRLNQASASTYRIYLERRLERAEMDLDSLLAEMQGFQEQYGGVEPDAQSAALMESLSSAGALVAEAEVAYEMIRSEFGDENEQTRTARAGLTAARAQRDRLTGGADAVMPIAIGRLPAVGRRYAQLQQGILLQGEILKELQPLYEQSLLTERRHSDAVQVVDAAIPPARKAEPRRSLLVIAATVSAGLLLTMLILGVAVVRRWAPAVGARLAAAGA